MKRQRRTIYYEITSYSIYSINIARNLAGKAIWLPIEKKKTDGFSSLRGVERKRHRQLLKISEIQHLTHWIYNIFGHLGRIQKRGNTASSMMQQRIRCCRRVWWGEASRTRQAFARFLHKPITKFIRIDRTLSQPIQQISDPDPPPSLSGANPSLQRLSCPQSCTRGISWRSKRYL
jgi:hypothetical protein